MNIRRLLNDKKILIAVFVFGAILVMIPTLMSGFDENKREAYNLSSSEELSEYSEMIENGLEKAVTQMVGDDNVKVMVTLESGFESIYYSDASVVEAKNGDAVDVKSEKQLVLTGNGGEQTPVIVKKNPPKIKGVVIVCSRGNDSEIKASISAMAATALNISETKIYVTGGN